jgi:hypothetical protein
MSTAKVVTDFIQQRQDLPRLALYRQVDSQYLIAFWRCHLSKSQ